MDLVSDLDEIPFLNYGLLDFKEYQKVNRYHGDNQSDIIAASIMTSRGCPYLCNFCASHIVHGRKIRRRSVERILAEIRELNQTYCVNTILIEDDHFIYNKQNALRILEEIFESVSFMKETGFNWIAIMLATPIAGSELYEICKKIICLYLINWKIFTVENPI